MLLLLSTMLLLFTTLLVMVSPMLPTLLVSMEQPQLQYQQFMVPMQVLVDILPTLLELFMLQSVRLMLNQKQMLLLCTVLMDIMDWDMDMDTVLTLLDMATVSLPSIMDMDMDMPGMDTMARDLLRLSQKLMLVHSMVLMVMVCMDLDTELILLDMVLDMDTLLFNLGNAYGHGYGYG